MIALKGYKNFELISESNSSLVVRAQSEDDGRVVVLKTVRAEFPTENDTQKIKNEFSILKTLNSDGGKPSVKMEKYNNSFVLISDDVGGESLGKLLKNNRLLLGEALTFATAIADFLCKVHECRIIHRDLNPSNIVVSKDRSVVQIIDFGLAISSEAQTVVTEAVGTLHYLAPEQTGRINRKVDQRSDLYAFGATLFEMFTGRHVFEAEDTLELVHSHLAKRAPSILEFRPDTPAVLASIVDKLLKKDPDERYQSAYGVAYDLHRCLAEFNQSGAISEFALASHDNSGKLEISRKLYGRENDLKQLIATFEEVTKGGSRIVLISGQSGVGKSALVSEMRKTTLARTGYYIQGKYAKFGGEIPFSALIEAVHSLIDQILASGDTEIQLWKSRILEGLKDAASVITEAIPMLEKIVGKLPPPQQAAPGETRARFNFAFSAFLKLIGNPQRPMTIFLDDLQWADPASFSLLEEIFDAGASSGLFFIGSYRDNEVTGTHPLNVVTESWRSKRVKFDSITLNSLTETDIQNLISDSLKMEDVGDLAKLVYAKAAGNPFFTVQLLTRMAEERLLTFSAQKGGWHWDVARLESMSATDNVIDFMRARIQSFDPNVVKLLQIGACIGDEFDVGMLAQAHELSVEQCRASLHLALDAGFISKVNDERFAFVHDKVREAAYEMTTEEQRVGVHHFIGQHLLSTSDRKTDPTSVFSIVMHLNLAHAKLVGDEQRLQVAELNLEAAQLAKQSAYFEQASTLAKAGLDALGKEDWANNFQLLFTLKIILAETLYLRAEHEPAKVLFRELREHTQSKFELAQLYLKQMQMEHAQDRYSAAMEYGLKSLALVGVRIPKKPTVVTLLWYVLRVNRNLKLDQLTYDPNFKPKEEHEFIVNALYTLGATAYFVDKKLFLVIACMGALKALEFRVVSIFPFITYGAVIGTQFKKYKRGAEIIEYSLKLSAASKKSLAGQAMMTRGGLFHHWVRPLSESIKLLREGFIQAQNNGEREIASAIALYIMSYTTLHGRSLEDAQSEIDQYMDFHERSKNTMIADSARAVHIFTQAVRGFTRNPNILKSEDPRHEGYEERLKVHTLPTPQGWYNYSQLWLHYLMGDFENARDYIKKSENYLANTPFAHGVSMRHFVAALVAGHFLPKASAKERKQYVKLIKASYKKFKMWVDVNPQQFTGQFLTLEAEMALAQGHHEAAMKHYSKAFEAAKDSGNFMHLGMIAERAANVYAEVDYNRLAIPYLREAHFAYGRWGATAIVERLEAKHPMLTREISSERSGTIASGSIDSKAIDSASILKSANSIIREIEMDGLLRKLLAIVMENAGADRGVLIDYSDKKGVVKIAGSLGETETAEIKDVPLEEFKDIAHSAVAYAQNKMETLIVEDASKHDLFFHDEYVKRTSPKSMLALPIVSSGKVNAVVYLENNSATGVFTEQHQSVLKVLASQASISLENARLYSAVAEKARMASELRTAQLVQQTLFPADKVTFKGLSVNGFYAPASECGGDWWFYHESGDKVFVYVGDATGHGAPAALMTSAARSAVSLLSLDPTLTPVTAMERLNRAIVETSNSSMNMTFFVASFDRVTGEFTYCNASHEAPFFVTKEVVEKLRANPEQKSKNELFKEFKNELGAVFDVHGPRLGESLSSKFSESTVKISQGDIVLLYTDGLTESFGPEGDQWGDRRVLRSLFDAVVTSDDSEQVLSKIIADNGAYRQATPLADDITVVTCLVKPS